MILWYKGSCQSTMPSRPFGPACVSAFGVTEGGRSSFRDCHCEMKQFRLYFFQPVKLRLQFLLAKCQIIEERLKNILNLPVNDAQFHSQLFFQFLLELLFALV